VQQIKPAQLAFSVHYNTVIITYLLYLVIPVIDDVNMNKDNTEGT